MKYLLPDRTGLRACDGSAYIQVSARLREDACLAVAEVVDMSPSPVLRYRDDTTSFLAYDVLATATDHMEDSYGLPP